MSEDFDLAVEENDVFLDSHDGNKVPTRLDPEWSDYVMNHLVEDELVDGNPSLPGLRRVIEVVLGEIMENLSYPVSYPNQANGFMAVARADLTVRMYDTGSVKRYADGADCSADNTPEKFAVHATNTACSKAESRVLRKALGLRKLITAEEAGIIEELSQPDRISPAQVRSIELLAKRNDINVWAYINAGETEYDSINSVPYDVAFKMVKFLNTLQNDDEKVRDEWRGYDPNWSKK